MPQAQAAVAAAQQPSRGVLCDRALRPSWVKTMREFDAVDRKQQFSWPQIRCINRGTFNNATSNVHGMNFDVAASFVRSD